MIAFLIVLGTPDRPSAHDLPTDVFIQIQMKAEGNRLQVLVRTPVGSMQDIEFPQRGPGYLVIAEADASLQHAVSVWLANDIRIYENGEPLDGQRTVAVRASIPSDRSFDTFDDARAHVLGPRLPDDVDVPWQQAMLDVLFEYPIRSAGSAFSIDPTLARLGLRTRTLLRFVLPDGGVRAFDYRGNPGLVRLDPRWSQVAAQFVALGFEHILDGTQYLLFLAALVIPFRRIRPIIAIGASFTVAHTATLVASAFGFSPGTQWFPPLVETLIAVSILYLASENILRAMPKQRWLVTFVFGLAYGFSFSSILQGSLQFAGGHTLTSLVAFNVGIELGQWLVVAAFAGFMAAMARFADTGRVATILASAVTGHIAWDWMTDRGGTLLVYRRQWSWPVFDLSLLAEALRWGTLLLIVVSLAWLMSLVLPRFERDGMTASASLRE